MNSVPCGDEGRAPGPILPAQLLQLLGAAVMALTALLLSEALPRSRKPFARESFNLPAADYGFC